MTDSDKNKKNGIWFFLAEFRIKLAVGLFLVVLSNGLNLIIPRLIGSYLDNNLNSEFNGWQILILISISIAVVVISLIQVVYTTILSEEVAKNLRQNLINSLSFKTFSQVATRGASDLITVFTSDVNNVKNLISQGLVLIFTSIILLVGSITMMLVTNWQLGLISIGTLPIIIITFAFLFSRIGPLFKIAQENLSALNLVINETVFGSALVRVLNSQQWEKGKFENKNQKAKDINIQIISAFSALIPIINIISNLGIVLVLYFGGVKIIESTLSLGQLVAFLSYYELLITPVLILGFSSQNISRGTISYERIREVLNEKSDNVKTGKLVSQTIQGSINIKNVDLKIGNKNILKDISFEVLPGEKVAIIGPTGAGKTQLFNIITGLTQPDNGEINIDGINIKSWNKDSYLNQIGLVFQDSLVFNTTLEENIRFNHTIRQENLNKAIYTSCLDEFVTQLPQGLNTLISERGSNLSGGQKQRLMLARALAVNPKILLLDDFTARVDNQTENTIWQRLKENYSNITILSITQKIEPIVNFEKIVLIMEGEIVAIGKHSELLSKSPEYQQIWNSQKTFNHD
jgi:ATP-binding cassette, subfamily B, bacterial